MSLLLATLMGVSCAQVAQMPIIVDLSPAVARRNAVLDFEVNYIDGPGGPQPVPHRCLSSWQVRGTDVKLDRSRQQLRIGAKAVAGETASLSFKLRGERVAKDFIVRGEDEAVLSGRWILAPGASCHLFPYVELVFDDAGNVTYTSPERMVESMTDGTLAYAWDPAQGRIASPLFAGASTTASVRGDELRMQPMRGCDLLYRRSATSR